eukprot:5740793-Pleurochrysis_carterae.AAC.1
MGDGERSGTGKGRRAQESVKGGNGGGQKTLSRSEWMQVVEEAGEERQRRGAARKRASTRTAMQGKLAVGKKGLARSKLGWRMLSAAAGRC